MLADIAILVWSLLLTTAGVATWTGAWRWVTVAPIIGWTLIAAIPMGLGGIIIGIAAITNVGGQKLALFVLGLFLVGLVLMFWEPKWLQPSWYKEPEGVRPIQRSFIAEAIRLFKERIQARLRASHAPNPDSGVLKTSRATCVSDQTQFFKSGYILGGRPGRLALYSDVLVFSQNQLWERVLEEPYSLRISLQDVTAVGVTKRTFRKALAATEVSGITSFRKRLRVTEDSKEHLFLMRRPEKWARLISQALPGVRT